MRIVTYNTRGSLGMDDVRSTPRIAETLRPLSADVICFQEDLPAYPAAARRPAGKARRAAPSPVHLPALPRLRVRRVRQRDRRAGGRQELPPYPAKQPGAARRS